MKIKRQVSKMDSEISIDFEATTCKKKNKVYLEENGVNGLCNLNKVLTVLDLLFLHARVLLISVLYFSLQLRFIFCPKKTIARGEKETFPGNLARP